MNPFQKFEQLGRKQLILQEGIQMMKQAQLEFQRDSTTANNWGMLDVLSSMTLIPANCIINAFSLGAAKNIYQELVRNVYAQVSKSGTRIDEKMIRIALGALKKVVVDDLKKKGLTQYVPGANILIGLAEDSWAAWEATQRYTKGLNATASMINRNINTAINQLLQLGIQREQLHQQMQVFKRTA
jgi:hypothetical protein